MSMKKYYVDPETGRIGYCEATVKSCKHASDNHYTTIQEAKETSQKIIQGQSPYISTLQKTPKISPTLNKNVIEDLDQEVKELGVSYAGHLRFVPREEDYHRALHKEFFANGLDQEVTNPLLNDYPDRLKELKNGTWTGYHYASEAIERAGGKDYLEKIAKREALLHSYARAYTEGYSVSPEIDREIDNIWNNPDDNDPTTRAYVVKQAKILENKLSTDITLSEDSRRQLSVEYEQLNNALETNGRDNIATVSKAYRTRRDEIMERLLTPTDEDRLEGRKRAIMKIAKNPDYEWATIMGPNIPKITAYNDKYYNKVEDVFRSKNPGEYSSTMKSMTDIETKRLMGEKVFAKAFEENFSIDPKIDDAFEKLYDVEHKKKYLGLAKEQYQNYLNGDMRAMVEGKTDEAQRMRHYSTRDFYERVIKDNSDAIKTRGRSVMDYIKDIPEAQKFIN